MKKTLKSEDIYYFHVPNAQQKKHWKISNVFLNPLAFVKTIFYTKFVVTKDMKNIKKYKKSFQDTLKKVKKLCIISLLIEKIKKHSKGFDIFMQMSITRALAELKLLDKKIEKATRQGLFVSTAVGKKPVKGYKTNEEFEQTATSQYQSVLALIKRRQVIKSAIVQSNATTVVEIAGVKMTVAEAIERKTSITYEQELLRKVSLDFYQANDRAETENERVKHRLDQLLEANFGKDAKAKDTEVEAIAKPFLEQNETKVIDPIGARKEIEKLQESIDNFLTEVDFVLSESNTITKIEIED